MDIDEVKEAFFEIRSKLEILPLIKDRIDKHELVLFGNGSVGLVKDVDRLVQIQARHSRWIKVFWGLLLAAFGDVGWHIAGYFKGR